jgi:hypothetical protein
MSPSEDTKFQKVPGCSVKVFPAVGDDPTAKPA